MIPSAWRARIGMRAALVTAAALAMVGGCHPAPLEDPRSPADSQSVTRRLIADSTWTVGVRIGGTQDDATLQGVMPPVVNREGLFLADMSAKRILHFDHAGKLRWRYGSPGGGPDELREPRDLEISPSGQIWVLDPANGRLTRLGPDGAVLGRISLAEAGAVPYQFVPLDDGGAILVVRNPERPFIRIDSLGDVVTATAFPWDDF